MTAIIILWDWDGTLVDTMPKHADLAAECIEKYLKIPREEARKRYLETAGAPFHAQLVEISGSEQKECADEYHSKKISKVYKNVKSFPETKIIIKALAENFAELVQVISSSTEEKLIEKWAEKTNLSKYFFRIYGYNHGRKEDHIALVRKMFPMAKIVFISDSARDMNLNADYKIGIAGNSEKEFFAQGADTVFPGPISAKEVFWAICGLL